MRDDAEVRAATEILKSYGFSRVWQLTDHEDPTEEIFLVLPKELHGIEQDRAVRELMDVLPGRKVWIAPHVPIAVTDLY